MENQFDILMQERNRLMEETAFLLNLYESRVEIMLTYNEKALRFNEEATWSRIRLDDNINSEKFSGR